MLGLGLGEQLWSECSHKIIGGCVERKKRATQVQGKTRQKQVQKKGESQDRKSQTQHDNHKTTQREHDENQKTNNKESLLPIHSPYVSMASHKTQQKQKTIQVEDLTLILTLTINPNPNPKGWVREREKGRRLD